MICIRPIDGKSHITCGMCEKLGECGGIHTMLYNDKPLNTIPMPEVKQPRDDFMDAKEAYEATNSIIDKYNTTEIQKIKSKILETINEGHFDLFVYRHISDLTKEYFENKNYKITENNDRYCYFVKISWNRTERV